MPDNACGQYFQYVQSGIGGFSGQLTLALQNGRNRIDVRFSQRGAQDQAVVGPLLPYPDDATARANFQAAKFRLNLWPDSKGVLPKLTRIVFNDIPLCTGSEYAPPNSYFNRFYVIDFNGRPAVPRVFPTVFNGFGGDGSVEVRVINTPSVHQLSEGDIPNLIASWINEQPSTSVPARPVWTTGISTPIMPWPTPATTTTTTVSIVPAAPAPIPSFPTQLNPNPVVTSGSKVCGEEGTITPFIQNGEDFPRGKYPWLTAIFHKENFALAFKCGGSLISETMVVTAAHCVYTVKEDRVVVSMGRYDLDNYHEQGAEGRDIVRAITHPDFSTLVEPDSDIALLILQRPVIFNEIIRPICLWESTESEVTVESGSVAGWGTDELGNSVTRYPHVVEAKIASDAECASKWSTAKSIKRTLCAGNLDGSGPCLGDSGGGLMVKRNNRWLLRGVVSKGERSTVKHCNNNQYVLYCDVSKHLTWIRQNLR